MPTVCEVFIQAKSMYYLISVNTGFADSQRICQIWILCAKCSDSNHYKHAVPIINI